jgi:1-acyl-sn-glycerol-3-phosphate acyltransferase
VGYSVGNDAYYRVGSRLLRAGFRAVSADVRSIGHEQIPAEGPAILASNHISYLDFACVCLAPPAPRRPVRFLARKDFFDRRVPGFLLRRLGQIPVDVHGDAMAAAAVATDALRLGELVGLHPEGTISPSFVPRRAKSGAVRLAERAGVPIVPVAVWGSQRLLTKGRPVSGLTRGATVLVRYGEPFRPSGRTAMSRTQELMQRITDLLEQNQAAYPQRPGPPPDDWWIPAHLGGSAPTPEEADERIRLQVEERRRRARGVA